MSYQLFIFSDVHGCYDSLLAGLKKAGFSINDPTHILISCGDLFDRGPKSKEIYLFLANLVKLNRFYGIYGNHDDMLLQILVKPQNTGLHLFNMQHNGTYYTLESLIGESLDRYDFLGGSGFRIAQQKILSKYPDLLDFLSNKLVGQITIDDHYILLHAGYKYDDNDGWMINNWTNTIKEFIDVYPYQHDKVFIFGHFWAAQLNKVFVSKYANYQLGDDNSDFNIFKYKNYLGIDGYVNATKIVNVITLKVDSLDKIVTSNKY